MADESIASQLIRARTGRSVRALTKALGQVVREGRVLELAYGACCFARFQPSPVRTAPDAAVALGRVAEIVRARTRELPALEPRRVVEELSGRFAASELPRDLTARRQTIVAGPDWCVVGEYGRASARLCWLSRTRCHVIDHYNEEPGVRHIHCVHAYGANALLVSTGDSKKLLDLWNVDGRGMRFVKRVMSRFAGFTASTSVAGGHYFGTDFDMRPNYILRWEDRRPFFFPRESFTRYALSFDAVGDRFIVALGATRDASRKWAVTVFDAAREAFVYAAPLPNPGARGARDA